MHLRVARPRASKRFYAAVAEVLGFGPIRDGEGWFSLDELFVSAEARRRRISTSRFRRPIARRSSGSTRRRSPRGGTDNGGPGEREYHPGYYAAYVLDPDGNNVEAVHHGEVERSAPSVVFRW